AMATPRRMERDQLVAITAEQSRRKRAEMRRSYGNKFSSINLSRMQQKQANGGGSVLKRETVHLPPGGTMTPAPLGALPKDMSLRRIASSFAHVQDLDMGSCAALPHEDSEEDAREERAEVLIRSQTMPLAPEDYPPSATAFDEKEMFAPKKQSRKSQPEASLKQPPEIPEALHLDSRATERWQQLGSTVSALFRARRFIDSPETPMAQTRRLREQRELLESFTRPFLFEASKRE
ncbi:hypothetical protein KR009_011673, partial [Drosophila setifemur]